MLCSVQLGSLSSMAVAIQSPQNCAGAGDHRAPGTLTLQHHNDVNRSSRRKRSTRRFQRNAETDRNSNHGIKPPATDFGSVRILKRGEVLDEKTEDDFNKKIGKKLPCRTDYPAKQILYSDSNVDESYSGITCLYSPDPSLVPLPKFLFKRDI